MTKEQIIAAMKERAEAFCKERDEVLLSGDLDRVIEFQKKYNPRLSEVIDSFSREKQEAGMHKAITAMPSLPRSHRMKSKHWLVEHGYQSWDDGDLNDA